MSKRSIKKFLNTFLISNAKKRPKKNLDFSVYKESDCKIIVQDII